MAEFINVNGTRNSIAHKKVCKLHKLVDRLDKGL